MSLKQELWRQYRHNQAQLHPLRTLFWECTLRCNMHCRHCGSDCKVNAAVSDMPAADFFKAIDDITPHVDPHKVFVILTGGEPLLRDDIDACGLELYRRGFPWGMVTNGFLLNASRLNRLLRSGIHSMAISLDGLQPEHDWVRQTPNGFAHAVDAIRLLGDTPDLLWDVVTCVNPRNIHQLAEIKELLISLGCRRWRIFSIFPMGRAASDPQLQLSDEQFTSVLNFVHTTRQEGRIVCNYACEGYLGDYERQVRDNYYYCRAGIEVASVLCDGSISGCTSIRSNLHQGNIYQDNLWDIWDNQFQLYRDRSWAKKDQCAHCKSWRHCEGNGLHLYDENGQLLSCSLNRIVDNRC